MIPLPTTQAQLDVALRVSAGTMRIDVLVDPAEIDAARDYLKGKRGGKLVRPVTETAGERRGTTR